MNEDKEKTKPLTVRFPVELYNYIKVNSDKERRSMGQQVIYFIQHIFENKIEAIAKTSIIKSKERARGSPDPGQES